MSINLKKGDKVNLSKENAGLSKVIVGLGWDPVKRSAFGTLKANFDCDSVIICLKNDKFHNAQDLIYYGHKEHKSGAIIHDGDNTTGIGEGDDEQIIVNLDKVPMEYNRLIIAVNIYKCRDRKQDFGMIKSAYCRLIDKSVNQELYRYNLTEDYKGRTAMIFGELYREDGDWKFTAVGEGTNDTNLNDLVKRYA